MAPGEVFITDTDARGLDVAAEAESNRAGGTPITWEQRDATAAQNEALLERDLRQKRLLFESRPYEAHVQFSNFCNMSCIMCWDGDNPPLKKMSPVVLERLRNEIAPHLSVITPHDGSEPTVVTWDEMVALAKDYSVQLELVTNGQAFDEEKFHEVKDHIEMLVLSVDSHLPDLFEKIRPGAKAEVVYRNVERAVRLCEENGIECIVQIVFMTLNAPHMPDLVAWLGERGVRVVNIIQMIDVNRRSWHLDATMHFSAEYLDWVKKQCVAVAEQRKLKLGWWLSGHQWFDFREEAQKVRPRPGKIRNDRRDAKMKLLHPGFCRYAYDRLRIAADGHVSPCGLDGDRELDLGTLAKESFEGIWNGPSARDLRRGHYTWDYPSLCASCRFVDLPPAQSIMPFVDHHLTRLGRPVPASVAPVLTIESPDHMLRTGEAPTFVLQEPDMDIVEYLLLLSPGGEADGTVYAKLEHSKTDGRVSLKMPESKWEALETNIGYWWIILGTNAQTKLVSARTTEIRCLIRHEALPRVDESRLKYSDKGEFSFVYLGGGRQVGWKERGDLPTRPPLRNRGSGDSPGPRFLKLRKVPSAPVDAAMGPDAYREMTGHVRDVVRSALPDGAVAVVASKGDQALLECDGRTLRHFPADASGIYVGYHPPDDAWAIERLERARAEGAQFLVIPASMRWWLDHYKDLVEHLHSNYGQPIADDRERCTIFPLQSRKSREPTSPGSGSELAEAADRALGYDGHHRQAFRRFHAAGEDVFPRFAQEAAGYQLVDTEGRAFIDWVSGGGPVILGYGYPAVAEAISAQLPVGPTLTLTHPIEVEVATLLTEMIPCAEMVAFGKNGSDAVGAAVRIARAVTGREVILQHGVHGFHDWYVAVHGVAGVPSRLGELVRSFPYNDLDALAMLFEEHRGEVAAVVMEPVNVELPAPGYLEGVQELARQHGALLVFDEVITAFRLGNGGAQERFGVMPDLACLGKALANGMPLSAVVGKGEYVGRLPELAYGMTFRGETLSLAAARAVLRVLRDAPVAEHLARVGADIRDAFDRACSNAGIAAALRGPEARMTFVFGNHAAVPPERLEAAFVIECARRGVLTNGNILPSLAHDDVAIARTAEVFAQALEPVRALVDAGSHAVAAAMRAGFARASTQPPAAQGELPAAFLDAARDEGGRLQLSGWMLSHEGGACTVEMIGPRGATRTAGPVDRVDLTQAWPATPAAKRAGFSVSLPADEFVKDGRYEFVIRGHDGEKAIFECPVSRSMSHTIDPEPGRVDDNGTLRL
jgi:glutamate-1-semialdehyde aminotransferase/MoaA/NifB/PqqE/SkfB family radical SAM enzyme